MAQSDDTSWRAEYFSFRTSPIILFEARAGSENGVSLYWSVLRQVSISVFGKRKQPPCQYKVTDCLDIDDLVLKLLVMMAVPGRQSETLSLLTLQFPSNKVASVSAP